VKPSRRALTALTLLLAALAPGGRANAHVGTSDVFHEGDAGPYRLLVSVRPPDVIPGTAQVEVRAATAAAKDLRVTIVPLPLSGSAAAPTPDVAVRSVQDPSVFTGQLWLMATGSWQVRVHVDGPAGSGDLAVPVPALPLRTKVMGVGLGSILLGLLIFLFAGLVSIVGASVRDGDLPPDQTPDARRRRRGRIAQATAAVVLLVVVIGGASWWDTEARGYQRWVYKPLTMQATAAPDPTTGGAVTLSLSLRDPGWIKSRRLDDLLPDHGHLMHLFVVRLPEMDFVGHLHPQQQTPGLFTKTLPALPPGDYQVFADIVHRTGLPETAIAQVTLPAALAAMPTGDDSIASAPPLQAADVHRTTAALPDGTRITWLREPGPIVASRPTWFRFKVEDRDGKPAADLSPYMGMAGHALFIKHDRTVFAHVHPTGSVPMAALMLVNPTNPTDPHAGHAMHRATLPPEVGFPFACPQPGRYRILVQVKRGDTVETGAFDTDVR
jgi:hypothetical protein